MTLRQRRRALMGVEDKSQPLPDLSVLPDQYQRVEFLKSDGDVYFSVPINTSGGSISVYSRATASGNVLYHSGTSGYARQIYLSTDGKFTTKGVIDETSVRGKLYDSLSGTFKSGYVSDQTTTLLSNSFAGNFYGLIRTKSNSANSLVPCYRKSDGVIGLYWTYKNAFYENQGTGTLTKGPDVT